MQALRLFPAVVIVPTMQISWTLFSVVSGGIYYQEYQAFTPFSASMFGLGVLVSTLSSALVYGLRGWLVCKYRGSGVWLTVSITARVNPACMTTDSAGVADQLVHS